MGAGLGKDVADTTVDFLEVLMVLLLGTLFLRLRGWSITLVKDGDIISIDTDKNLIMLIYQLMSLNLKKKWVKPPHKFSMGIMAKYQ